MKKIILLICLIIFTVTVNAQKATTIKTNQYKDTDLYSAEKEGKFGFIDKNGKLVIPYQFDNVGNKNTVGSNNCFEYGLCVVGNSNLKGVINLTGKYVIPCIYDGAFIYSNSLVKVYKGSGGARKEGFYDRTGKVLLPCEYFIIGSFKDGLAYAIKINDENTESYLAVIDENINILLPPTSRFSNDSQAGQYDKNFNYIVSSKGHSEYALTKRGLLPCDKRANPTGPIQPYSNFAEVEFGGANAQPPAASCDLICDLFFSNAWHYGVGWLHNNKIYQGNTGAFDDRLITEFPAVAFVNEEGTVHNYSNFHKLITYEKTGKLTGKFYDENYIPRKFIGSHKRGYNNRDFIYDKNGNEAGYISYSDNTPLPQIASAAAYLLLVLKLESPGKIKYNNK